MISLDLLEGNMRSDIMCKHNKESMTQLHYLSWTTQWLGHKTPDSVDIKR